MVKLTSKKEKKEYYDKRVCVMLEEYTQALICAADNVGSKQFQDIRSGLRPESVVLMGKNTLLKRTIRQYVEKTGATQWLAMLPLLVVSFRRMIRIINSQGVGISSNEIAVLCLAALDTMIG